MMVRRQAVFVVMLGIGCATTPTADPAVATPPAGNLYTRIPTEIGAFKLTERTIVRGAPADSVFRFRDTTRTILTVIIYEVPDDVAIEGDSQKWTAREGAKFKDVQDSRVQRGQIAAYVLAFSDTSRFAVGERSLLEHAIGTPVRYRNGVIAVDMQYLYLIDDKFVKVRATIPEKGWQQTRVPSFARELARRLAQGT